MQIKICGITTPDDALAAVDAGAHALGLNFHPVSPRHVTLLQAVEIRKAVPPFVPIVGVFIDPTPEELVLTARRAGLDAVQLHGDESPSLLSEIPLRIFRGVRADDPEALDELPSWRRAAGVVVAPSLAADVRERTSLPMILAGGITPENVAAILGKALREGTPPSAIDVSSGVESSTGRKDPRRIRALIDAVRNGLSGD